MKMMYIRVAILAYFLTDTLNWQVLKGKEKCLLNSLCEKLKQSRICLIYLFQGQTNRGQIYSTKFLNSIKFPAPEKF